MSTKETGTSGPTSQSIDEPNDESGDGVAELDESSTEDLSLDHIFEILKNRRRREVMCYLREKEEKVTLSDLAEHIAALENDTDVASITSSQRKRVYVGLYQCHLPKMADMDIVDFNQNRGTVALDENAQQLYEYLDNETQNSTAWHRYYLGLSLVGILLFVVSILGGQTGLLPLLILGSLCSSIAVCATAHWRSRQTEQE